MHQDFIFKKIEERCWNDIQNRKLRRSDEELASEVAELASEVACKLVGATTASPLAVAQEADDTEPSDVDEETDDDAESEEWPAAPTDWLIDDRDPSRDGRVEWLIASCTTKRALEHRREDIRRRNFGRRPQQPNEPTKTSDIQEALVTGSYRTTQISAFGSTPQGAAEKPSEEDVLGSVMLDVASHPPSQERALFAADDAAALRGLFQLAASELVSGDEVLVLIQLLHKHQELWEEFRSDKRGRGTGFKWPVDALVAAHNEICPNRVWEDTDVENAKRRLSRFIIRKMRELGCTDRTDMKGLLARLGRTATKDL
jgi:hypothetical protein